MAFLFIMKNEIWKTIEGFEDYQVSNFGRVKSLKRCKELILKQSIDSRGYYIISLCKNSKKPTKSIHQLVAIAFLEHKVCGYKLVVNHKDFNRLNNQVDNLEIISSRENVNQKHLKSTSKYVGVSLHKQTKKWASNIHINGKQYYLGLFNNEYDAHLAYESKLKEIC